MTKPKTAKGIEVNGRRLIELTGIKYFAKIPKICKAFNCHGKHYAKGFCSSHYYSDRYLKRTRKNLK